MPTKAPVKKATRTAKVAKRPAVKKATARKGVSAVAKKKPTATKAKAPAKKSTAKKSTAKKPAAPARSRTATSKPAVAARKETASSMTPTVRIAVARPAASRHHAPAERAVSIRAAITSPAPLPAPNLLEEGLDADPGTLPTDQVFDEADQAQWMQLREQAEILRRGRQMNQPEQHPDFDGKHCVECDIEIPAARLAMHKVRCVDCQEELEENRRRASRAMG